MKIGILGTLPETISVAGLIENSIYQDVPRNGMIQKEIKDRASLLLTVLLAEARDFYVGNEFYTNLRDECEYHSELLALMEEIQKSPLIRRIGKSSIEKITMKDLEGTVLLVLSK